MRRFIFAVALAAVASIAVAGEDPQTRLMEAIRQGDAERVGALLREGADAEEADSGMSPAEVALLFADLEVLRAMKAAGVKLSDVTLTGGWSALDLVMFRQNSSAELVAFMLDEGMEPSAHYSGKPLLMLPAAVRNPEIARMLIDRGEDVNGADATRNWNPLATAAWDGSPEVVKLLLEKGARVGGKLRGRTPLHYATRRVTEGSAEVVRALCAAGANPNEADPTGWTPLGFAIYAQADEVVRVLLEHGADVNKKIAGRLPIIHAAANANGAVVSALLKGGADVNARDAGGFSPLIMAIRSGDPSDPSGRLQHEEESEDQEGMESEHAKAHSAVERASRLDTMGKVRVLLEAGADVNREDDYGWNALAYGAGLWSIDRLKMMEGQRWNGRILREFEQRHDPVELVKLLVKHGAVRLNGGRGPDALDTAAQRVDSHREPMLELIRKVQVRAVEGE